ncbi:MAG: allantoinase [Nitrospinota bacterium]
MRHYSLVYGMRLFPKGEVASVDPAPVVLRADGGRPSRVRMHLMEGTREQLKSQFLRSVEAFFELEEEREGGGEP